MKGSGLLAVFRGRVSLGGWSSLPVGEEQVEKGSFQWLIKDRSDRSVAKVESGLSSDMKRFGTET